MAIGIDDVVMGGASALGNVASSAYSAMKQEEVNRNAFYDTLQADNTQYQRSVADLKAAGLNPMLAYMSNPDPTPNMQAPVFQNPAAGSAFSQGVSSAAAANQADTSAAYTQGPLSDQTRANAENISADTILKGLQQLLTKANITNVDSQSARNYQDVKESLQRIQESVARIPEIKARARESGYRGDIDSVEANLYRHGDKILNWLEGQLSSSGSSASDWSPPAGTPPAAVDALKRQHAVGGFLKNIWGWLNEEDDR